MIRCASTIWLNLNTEKQKKYIDFKAQHMDNESNSVIKTENEEKR